MKTWFSVEASTANGQDVIDTCIHDDIGAYGVSARDYISSLQAKCGGKKKIVNVSINSPGGDVFAALAINNALRSMAETVNVRIIGVAASAASIIAMAGDTITMPANTFMMIHNPWAYTAGNADELREFADTLDTIGSSLVKTYVARTGLDEAKVKELLAAETWLTAEDAVAMGFATSVEAVLKVAASYDVERFPEKVRAIFAAAKDDPQAAKITVIEIDTDPEEDDPEDPNSDPANKPACAFADEIVAYAKTLGLAEYATVVAIDSTINDMAGAKARLDTAREVNALCALAGKKDMASGLITAGADISKARVALTDALASDADKSVTSSIRPAGHDRSEAAGGSVWSKIFPPAAQK